MTRKEFISDTVMVLDSAQLELLKERLLGEYISFQIIEDKDVNQLLFSEKLLDYFEKLKIKTDLTFNKVISKYIADWDEIVQKGIPESSSDNNAANPRSRKYYERALQLKDSREITIRQLLDYTRIMMCLYMGIIGNEGKKIKDFDFSIKCLDLDEMISQMKKEKVNTFPFGTKKKFDLAEVYSGDTSTFIMTMIMFYFIKNNEIKEG